MSAKRTIFNQRRGKQRGAVLMVMLVIMIIGAVTIFVMSLNSSALQLERDKVTADALVKAKNALIGRAVADLTSPGSLPCPDTNDDGSAQSPVGQPGGNCPSYIGRLPWKSLGLSDDLRDGSGERLWYVLSPNFLDNTSVNYINSNRQGNLSVSGTVTASNVIAIVFAPGAAVNGQSRSATNTITCTTSGTSVAESLCATNYLEGSNANLSPQSSPNLSYQTAAASSTFNDRLLIIRASDIIPLVEMRVAKELSNAFASYLSTHSNKYPYPANFNCTSATNCTSDTTQCIGKIPALMLSVSSLTSSVTVATATTTTAHGLLINSQVTISGATPSGYNGTFTITGVPAANQFTYTVAAGLATPATGTITAAIMTTPPWFTTNNWFDVIYYTASTNALPGGGVVPPGNRWLGRRGRGSGGGGGGGGTPVTGFGCYTALSASGSNVNALFIMPGTPLGTQSRTGTNASLSSSNLSNYFEDAENINLDNIYIIPSVTSNDTLNASP